MKALFLTGGMGTRLKPLTEDLPKPMVPMMVKPLLERNMLKLKDCGVDEISQRKKCSSYNCCHTS